MRLALCVVVAMAAAGAGACLNDRDTLAAEVLRKPDVLWVIVGRFERNPPLYYQMRIGRIERELASHPERLDLYDDICVAYDRLHQDDEALIWAGRKRVVLEKLGMKGHEMDWYRFYANAGTFHAHRFFGATPFRPADLKTAEEYIAKAVEINPGAHFGREGYQLAAIRWTLASLDINQEQIPFAKSPELKEAIRADHESGGVEGLSGLVRLGGAWESPDIFDALAGALGQRPRMEILAEQAILRRDELVAGGLKAGPLAEHDFKGDDYMARNRQEFYRLRADADAWAKQRSDFMIARMRQGKHPDTDPDFWKGYIERPKPEVWAPPWWETIDWFNRVLFPGLLILPAAIVVLVIARLIYRVARRNRYEVG